MEHRYVDNRPLSEEIKDANETLAARIVAALKDSSSSEELRKLASRP